MSWSFEYAVDGKDAAKDKLAEKAEQVGDNMPGSINDMIANSIDAMPNDSTIIVKTHGHLGTGTHQSLMINVLAQPVPKEEPAAEE